MAIGGKSKIMPASPGQLVLRIAAMCNAAPEQVNSILEPRTP